MHQMRQRDPVLRLLAVGALLAGLLLPGACRAQRAVILVRHAEKVDDSHDPPLSAAGQARAAALARLLRDAGIGAIFVTDFQRTQQTAAPLAQKLGLQPVRVPAADTAGLIRRLRAHPGEVVLVVGHADTLPAIIQELGHKGPPIRISRDAFDGLYFVVQQGTGQEPLFMTLRMAQ